MGRFARGRRVLACLVPAIAAFAAAQSWFVPGSVVAAGDVTPSVRPGWEGQYADHWNDLNGGPGAPAFTVIYLPEMAFTRTARAIGLNDSATQRAWISLLYAGAAAAIAWLALGFSVSGFAAAAAGLVGVFNMFFLMVSISSVMLTAFISAALLGGVVIRAASRRMRAAPAALAAASLGVGHAFINPPLVGIIVGWVLVVAAVGIWLEGREGARRLRRLFFVGLPLTLLANAWWITSAWLTLNGPGASLTAETLTAQRDVLDWSWTHAHAGLSNVMALGGSWGWKEPAYFPFAARLDAPPLGLGRYLLPLGAFLAPVLANGRARRAAFGLGAAALASIWIAKGLNEPLSTTNLFLYDRVPGFWLFREPVGKALIVTALCYALMAAITLQEIMRRLPRWSRSAGALSLVIVTVASPYPLWNGDVVPDKRPLLPPAHVRIPNEWKDAAHFLNREDPRGKLLVLPLADYYQMPTTWGYYGADLTASLLVRRPVLALVPSGYYSPPGSVAEWLRSIEGALLGNNTVNLRASLAALGVRYVLLRRDLDLTFPDRHFTDPAALSAPLHAAPGLTRVRSFGFLDLYRVSASSEVSASTQVVRYRGVRDLYPVVVPALPAASVITDLGGADAGADAFAFDVTSAGSAGEASGLGTRPGTYRLVPTRRHGTLRDIRIANRRSGLDVTLADAVTISIGKRTYRLEPTLTASLPPAPQGAVVRIGERLIDLGSLRQDGQAGKIIDRGNLKVSVYRPARSATLQFGAVGDCFSKDDRALKRSEINGSISHGVIRLSARTHIACVNAPVAGFQPDALYRLKFEYRTPTGSAARVCLWQDGAERCAALPALRPSASWTRFDSLVRPDSEAVAMRAFLYADGGASEPSITEYRGISVQRFDPSAPVSLEEGKRGSGLIEISPGTPVKVSPGGDSANGDALLERSVVESLGDCFRIDERLPEQLGFGAALVSGGRAIQLSAREHISCVNLPLQPFEPTALYRVRMDYRSLRGHRPRICLWQEGVDQCAPAPNLQRSTQWGTIDTIVAANPRATGMRLFLYAEGGSSRTTVVLYRNVRVTKLPPAEFVVIPTATTPPPPVVTFTRTKPSEFRVRISNATGSFVLHTTETYAPGWSLIRKGHPSSAARHLRVNGYANGWLIPWQGTYEIRLVYRPSSIATWGKRISLISLAGIVGAVLAVPIRRIVTGRRGRRSRRGAGSLLEVPEEAHV